MDEPRLFDPDEIDRRNRYVEPGERAKARRTDPDTSRDAAAAVTVTAAGLALEILEAFHVHGALTDDELCGLLAHRYAPTVKTARSRLSGLGDLVDTGWRRKSVRGRLMIVWCLDGDPLRPEETVRVRDGVL